MSQNAIEVKELIKVYKLYENPMDRLKESLKLTRKVKHTDHFALDKVDFSVKKGETVGIIGTNGSGKSTILKIITGVLNPTSGSVNVDGRISALLELGAGFNQEYTGIENVYLNGTMIGFSKEEIDKRLDDILKFADIGDFVYQPVKTYSSGMFIRLAFAVAINIDPEILIVDEALSVGDVFFQAKCYHKFDEFKKQGKTILFVSHDLSSINKYCDRVVLLNRGHKLAEGSPAEMIDMYKKVMVNQLDAEEAEDAVGDIEENGRLNQVDSQENSNSDVVWKESLVLNPDQQIYGNGLADIVDFSIEDDKGRITNSIIKNKEFTIRMKIAFHEEVQDPIFAITIKNLKGTDITGTNTMLEKCHFDTPKDGDVYEAEFRQKMNLQGGEYLLSFGCTGYHEGEFTVYQRVYDACNITVISDKDSVGFYDMNSKVKVKTGK